MVTEQVSRHRLMGLQDLVPMKHLCWRLKTNVQKLGKVLGGASGMDDPCHLRNDVSMVKL